MRHEEKKVSKIIEELTIFFFAIGADDMESSIKRKGNHYLITFRANYDIEYKENLNSLEEFLNEQKNDGIEDIYWELAGSGEPGETSQLLLVGMMIDKAEIEFNGDYVHLTLYKELLN